MGRFGQSVFYGFLLSFYFMCFYYAFGVFQTIFEHGDVVAFALNSVVVGFVVWIFASFLCYELSGSFERLNRRRDEDDRNDGGNGSDPKAPNHRSDPGAQDKHGDQDGK